MWSCVILFSRVILAEERHSLLGRVALCPVGTDCVLFTYHSRGIYVVSTSWLL